MAQNHPYSRNHINDICRNINCVPSYQKEIKRPSNIHQQTNAETQCGDYCTQENVRPIDGLINDGIVKSKLTWNTKPPLFDNEETENYEGQNIKANMLT